MRWKGVKLFVIAAAFLMLYGWKPEVGAQSPNCRCYGTIKTYYHPPVVINPLCGSHDFDWWSIQGSGGACKSWCEAILDFPADVYCHDDFGLGACGDVPGYPQYPSHFGWNGHWYYYGPPPQTQPVTKSWTRCSI